MSDTEINDRLAQLQQDFQERVSDAFDELLHNLLRRAKADINGGYSDTGKEYLKLAIRTQSPCRVTLESLTALNRPIVRETNIAHGHPQVNNYTENASDKPMEKTDNQRLNLRAPSEAIRRWRRAGDRNGREKG